MLAIILIIYNSLLKIKKMLFKKSFKNDYYLLKIIIR